MHNGKKTERTAQRVWASVRAERGALTRIAAELGVHRQALDQWTKVPLERVVEIERITGIPREWLRPDYHLPRAKGSNNVGSV